MNQKMILGVSIFLGGVLGSGLFAIAQSLCNVAQTLGDRPQNVCGILSFAFLLFALVGIVLMILEVRNKKNK